MEIKLFAFLFANRGFILMFALDVLLMSVADVIFFLNPITTETRDNHWRKRQIEQDITRTNAHDS